MIDQSTRPDEISLAFEVVDDHMNFLSDGGRRLGSTPLGASVRVHILLVFSAMLASLTLAMCPQTTVAETQQHDLSVEDLRTALFGAGYATRDTTHWTSDVLAFQVDAEFDEQPTHFWVFVYPTTVAADSARRVAIAQTELCLDHPIPQSTRRGPPIVSGYGASFWLRNLAAVQEAPFDDGAAWSTEPVCEPVAMPTAAALAHGPLSFEGLPQTLVSDIFIHMLESASSW
jgi:hypothetical protein